MLPWGSSLIRQSKLPCCILSKAWIHWKVHLTKIAFKYHSQVYTILLLGAILPSHLSVKFLQEYCQLSLSHFCQVCMVYCQVLQVNCPSRWSLYLSIESLCWSSQYQQRDRYSNVLAHWWCYLVMVVGVVLFTHCGDGCWLVLHTIVTKCGGGY